MNSSGTNMNGDRIETFFVYDRCMKTRKDVIFQKNLNSLLKERGLSLHQLSKMTNINKSTLHNYLNGVLPQGLITLIKLSHFLEIPIEDLVFGKINSKENLFNLEGKYEIVIKKK